VFMEYLKLHSSFFHYTRMHSCLLIASDGEHQRRVFPMKKGENKHSTLVILDMSKRLSEHFCLSNVKAANNRAFARHIC
jgi:hypothetical protein